MEPAVGFEPTTDGLQNRCSTTELSWRSEAKCYIKKESARKVYHACGRSLARDARGVSHSPFTPSLALHL